MSKNHVNRFLKRNKLKPRKLDINFLESLNNTNYNKLSTTIVTGKNITCILLLKFNY